jgi:hypothetical protein
MKRAFHVRHLNGEAIDHIGDREFFNPNEILAAGRIFQGSFDKHWQFSGNIKVFCNPVLHTQSWRGAKDIHAHVASACFSC